MEIKKWVVKEHVDGVPAVKKIYKKVVEDIDVKLKPDEMLFETKYVSVDPYLHGICLDTPIGQHMGADSIMQVLEAGPNAMFKVGDLVQGFGGWQSHVISDGKEKFWQTGLFPMVFPDYRLLNPKDYSDDIPITTSLGVLGGPGMTVWGTMTKFFNVKKGETVFISGASGSIGMLVGQMAKMKGARVVGTAGSQEKGDYLKDLGFDEVINYKEANDTEKMSEALSNSAPNGIDKYFDNIGGYITDAVFPQLNVYSQVAICWQWLCQVNGEHVGPRLFPYMMFPRTTVRGIYSLEWFTEKNWKLLIEQMSGFIKSGEIKFHEIIHDGFDAIPDAYQSLFTGNTGHQGKVLVKLS